MPASILASRPGAKAFGVVITELLAALILHEVVAVSLGQVSLGGRVASTSVTVIAWQRQCLVILCWPWAELAGGSVSKGVSNNRAVCYRCVPIYVLINNPLAA